MKRKCKLSEVKIFEIFNYERYQGICLGRRWVRLRDMLMDTYYVHEVPEESLDLEVYVIGKMKTEFYEREPNGD